MPTQGLQFAIFLRDFPGEAIYPTYFPEEMQYEYGMQFAEGTIPGRRNKTYQWISGAERPLPLNNLLFDGENRGFKGTSAKAALEWFETHVPPFEDGDALGGQQQLRCPPVFTVALFEKTISYDVLIKSATVRISQYDKQGQPYRLEASIQAVRFAPLIFQDGWKRSTPRPDLSEAAPQQTSARGGQMSVETPWPEWYRRAAGPYTVDPQNPYAHKLPIWLP